jgi:hypothetical protein
MPLPSHTHTHTKPNIKNGWQSGSGSRVPALQVGSPEFKSLYHKRKIKRKCTVHLKKLEGF